MDVKIRHGLKEDLPAVLDLIKELAEFEKEPQEVVVTLRDMERNDFGENPLFTFFVAETNNRVVGMDLYFINANQGLSLKKWNFKIAFVYHKQIHSNSLFAQVIIEIVQTRSPVGI